MCLDCNFEWQRPTTIACAVSGQRSFNSGIVLHETTMESQTKPVLAYVPVHQV